MLGIDLTKISRFKNPTEAFLKKILHPNELREYKLLELKKEEYLAARWAIKEALFKSDNSLFHFSKIEILKKDRIYKYPGYTISTSKEDDLYIAIVLKEK